MPLFLSKSIEIGVVVHRNIGAVADLMAFDVYDLPILLSKVGDALSRGRVEAKVALTGFSGAV